MQRPDTIIEIHRERVQDQTVEITLDRVWFIVDAQQRLWQELVDGENRAPLRHFAIDLVIFDSKITVDSVTCVPLVSLPPAAITTPDGLRAGESREIPYNEIPLFGRLTVHDQLEPKQVQRGKQTISLDFTEQDAPTLLAAPYKASTARSCSVRTSIVVPTAASPSPRTIRGSAGNSITPRRTGSPTASPGNCW